MNIPITFIIHWIFMLGILGTGISFFVSNAIQQEFLIALISLITPIIFVNIYGIIPKHCLLKRLDIFYHLLCF